MPLFVTIVLDGVGIGAQPDAAEFGDAGADTLGHVCGVATPSLPNMARWGLGRIRPLAGVRPTERPAADFGKMREISAGKDSTTGHWELAGIRMDRPLPTYPDGFPDDLVELFLVETGCERAIGNEAASGTEIVRRLGTEHLRTGAPIIYTSADSVFQVAAHVDAMPLERLYEVCRITRDRVCVGSHAVGRVIARPFHGPAGAFERISSDRRDYSLRPPRPPLQSLLQDAGVETVAIGKVGDLFDGVGFATSTKTRSNVAGIRETLEAIEAAAGSGRPTFIWTNLVDFDQEYGHRNDVHGFAAALRDFDERLPELEKAMPAHSVLLLTADHGNDPTFPGTDHTREYVPLLMKHERSGRDLGARDSFVDHAASVLAYFGLENTTEGKPFLPRAGSSRVTSAE